jgi:two-component system, cell cycle sensor histidine kinase and response regulator CckA
MDAEQENPSVSEAGFDRLRAQEALKMSEGFLRSIFDATPAGLCLLSDRVHLKVNKTFCRLTGYSEEELIGKGTRMMYPDETEYERVGRELYGRLKTEGQESTEARLKRKDGRLIDVLLSASPFNPDDLSAGTSVAILDITERKKAEIALRESEQRFSKAFRSSPAPIAITEFDTGKYLAANERYETLVGLKAAELIGRDFRDLGIGPSGRAVAEITDELRRTGTVRERPAQIVTKSGARREILWSAEKIELGEREAILSIMLDVTESLKNQEALIRNQKVLQSIFEATPIGLALTVDAVVRKANAALARILGYQENELVGKRLEGFFADAKDFKRMFDDLTIQMRRTGSGTAETRLLRKDGAGVDVTVRIGPVDKQDSSAGYAFALLDITERKRIEAEKASLEERLLHAQKMESIGRLAGGVAHDFNNLLTAIIGNTDMAMDLLEREGKPRALLAQALKAADGAANLTKQLLAFSHKQVVELQTVDLNGVLEGIKKMIRSLASENVELEWKPFYGLCPIKADPGQIEQVAMNLAVNARDAMPAGGRLAISTRNECLDEESCRSKPGLSPGEYAALEISDTGSGMPKETMDHLFEPFFTTKAKGLGTGLGLATVYGIVKQLGGAVLVDSVVGRGSVFTCYFPVSVDAPAAFSDGSPRGDMPRGKETILIVEDNPQVLDFSRDALMGLGYTVMTAMSGEEGAAISGAYDGPIDLLLTDIILPAMNGRQTSERIAKARPGMKTIYSSGYTAEVIDKQGILEEGLNFLPKPFAARELALKVRSVLDAI